MAMWQARTRVIDSRSQAASPTDSDTAVVETATESEPILRAAAAWAVPARGSRRLAAGAAGALLVLAVLAAALGSPIEDDAPECEGHSCRARLGHLDGVLMMKQNTMQLDDCPAGYEGSEANIKGEGKAWSFGNLTDCAGTCDDREGCKGFEFHDKNGRCGTYLDGYVLGGKQNHRWLTCIKQDVIRTAQAPTTQAPTTQSPTGMPTPSPTRARPKIEVESTVLGVDYAVLKGDQEAYEALETSMKETFSKLANVSPDLVNIDITAGSVVVKAEISVPHTGSEGDQLAAAGTISQKVTASVSDEIVKSIKQAAESNPVLQGAVETETLSVTSAVTVVTAPPTPAPIPAETANGGDAVTPAPATAETANGVGAVTPAPTTTETANGGDAVTPAPTKVETADSGDAVTPAPTKAAETANGGDAVTPPPTKAETADGGDAVTPAPTKAAETANSGDAVTPAPTEAETADGGNPVTPAPTTATETANGGDAVTPAPTKAETADGGDAVMPAPTKAAETANGGDAATPAPTTAETANGGDAVTPAPTRAGAECALVGEDCSLSTCCKDAGRHCFRKSEWWAGCKTSCTPGVDKTDPPDAQTPWECTLLEDVSSSTAQVPAPQLQNSSAGSKVSSETGGDAVTPAPTKAETANGGDAATPAPTTAETANGGDAVTPPPTTATETANGGNAVTPAPTKAETANGGDAVTPAPTTVETANGSDAVTPAPTKAPKTANGGDAVTPAPTKAQETANGGDAVTPAPTKAPETANSGDAATPVPTTAE